MSESAALIGTILVGIPSIIGAGYLMTRKITNCKIGCCSCEQLAKNSTTPRDQEMISALQAMSEANQLVVNQILPQENQELVR